MYGAAWRASIFDPLPDPGGGKPGTTAGRTKATGDYLHILLNRFRAGTMRCPLERRVLPFQVLSYP